MGQVVLFSSHFIIFAYSEMCSINKNTKINIKSMSSVTMLKHTNFYKKGLVIIYKMCLNCRFCCMYIYTLDGTVGTCCISQMFINKVDSSLHVVYCTMYLYIIYTVECGYLCKCCKLQMNMYTVGQLCTVYMLYIVDVHVDVGQISTCCELQIYMYTLSRSVHAVNCGCTCSRWVDLYKLCIVDVYVHGGQLCTCCILYMYMYVYML